MKIKKFLTAIGVSAIGISLAFAADYTITSVTNTASISDADTGHSANTSLSISHKQPNNTLIVQKWVDNPLPDLGETVTYTIRVKNDADEVVAKNVVLIDDFDETKVEIVGIDQTPWQQNDCVLDFSGTKFFDGQCFFGF